MQARHQVQQVLNQRLRGRVLPLVVVQMLVQAWSQVLQLAWLKQGEASQGWRDALQTVDALLASITPGHEPQALCSRCRACSRRCAMAWPAWRWIRQQPENSSCNWSSCTCMPVRALSYRLAMTSPLPKCWWTRTSCWRWPKNRPVHRGNLPMEGGNAAARAALAHRQLG